MSFPQKSFWMLGDTGCLTDGGYDHSSKVEQKRGHQWLTDSAGSELFSNKKQVIEAGTDRTGSGGVMDVSIWNNATSFPPASGPLSNRLFGSETAGNINANDRNVTSVTSGNMQMERHNFIQQYDFNSLVGLPVSQATEDPAEVISVGGIRKVKVSQVKDTRNDNPSVLGQFYSSNTLATAYNGINNDPISLGSTYTSVNDNDISISSNYGKEDGSFISMGHAFHKGNGNFISMGHHTKDEDSISFMGQPLDKRDANFMTMTPSYGRGESNSYDKEQDFISMASMYDKANNNFITMGPSYAKADENIILIGSTYEKAHSNVTSVGSMHDKGGSGVLSIGQNYYRSDINTISFDGFPVEPEENPSTGIISDYDSLPNNQMLNNASVAATHADIVHSDAPPVVDDGQTVPPSTSAAKTKEPKGAMKVTSNNFPSNVKSLLSTGMLDGVPVKYVSWSREKNLKATIKGTGYLCGCGECKFSKVVNAYEFERHANCKTKHPNNHIYFENGKTIYAVVQELKNTPQEILFEAIQSVTGSPINQKNFQTWKESYQAATRELQRIYGKN